MMMARWVFGGSWFLLACGPQVKVQGQPCESDDDCAEGQSCRGTCVDDEPSDSVSDSTTAGDDGNPDDRPDNALPIPTPAGADILLVIDNSGTMAEEQVKFAQALAQVLEAYSEIPFRIGITTTDNGNPWCPGTGPEGGKLVLSSCHSRIQDFIFAGAVTIDARDEACYALCPEPWSEIPIASTPTEIDPDSKPRPWIELGDSSNLPADLQIQDALGCLVPQGIAGCGFEEPLEAMYKAMLRSAREDEEQYGFLRLNAALAVVVLTDEIDCSYNKDHEDIFLPDGGRIFWSNPADGSPTSALCWNAGVQCTGSGAPYDECASIDLDENARPLPPTAADQYAVLRPVSRYVDLLQSIEDEKRQVAPGQEVVVAVIAGANPDGTITYADTPADPDFQINFGIGPGCQSESGRAVPPVRMAELARAFQIGDEQNIFSICNEDYAASVNAVIGSILDGLPPACMPACVADTDAVTEIVEPSCVLTQESSAGAITVPPCLDGQVAGEAVDVCYVALTDGAAGNYFTDDPSDDLGPRCREQGWNLEFQFVRRAGVPAPPGAVIYASCELSSSKAIDCPWLP